MEVTDRILKDIDIFSKNIKEFKEISLTDKEKEIVELAKMYCEDSKSWLKKGDLYTSFCSIAYAHGLLDAIRKIKGLSE